MQKKKLSVVSKIYIALIIIFLYAPITVMIIMSFSKSTTMTWKGFSLKWYGELFQNNRSRDRSRHRHQQFSRQTARGAAKCV